MPRRIIPLLQRSSRRCTNMSVLDRFQMIQKFMQCISETTRTMHCVVSSSVYRERPYEKSSRLSWNYAGHYLHELRWWSSGSSSVLYWSCAIGKSPSKGIIENQEIRKVGLSETHASGNREASTHNDWWKANWWNKYQQESARRTWNDEVWEF